MHKIQGVAIAFLASGITYSAQSQSCLMQTESGQTIRLVFCSYSPLSPSLAAPPSIATPSQTPTQSSAGECSGGCFEQAQRESSASFVLESVTREKWQEIYHRHYYGDDWHSVGHDAPLTLRYITDVIMGFSGEQVWQRGNSEKRRWTDAENPRKQIEIIFIDGQMHQGSATGL
ncbi:MAG: hypothetical protein ACFB4I_19415 [Cyanophyceae cyanobacterium]